MFVYMYICLCVSCYVVLYKVVMHLIAPILIEKQPKRCYMVDNWQLRSSHIIFLPPPFFLSVVYFSNRMTARIFSRSYSEHLITRRLTAFPTHLVILEPPGGHLVYTVAEALQAGSYYPKFHYAGIPPLLLCKPGAG